MHGDGHLKKTSRFIKTIFFFIFFLFQFLNIFFSRVSEVPAADVRQGTGGDIECSYPVGTRLAIAGPR